MHKVDDTDPATGQILKGFTSKLMGVGLSGGERGCGGGVSQKGGRKLQYSSLQ